MKHLILVILSIYLTACSDFSEGAIDPALKPYVEEIELLTGLNVPTKYNFEMVDSFKDRNQNGACEYVKRVNKGEISLKWYYFIKVKRDKWAALNHVQRLHLLTHEIAHCLGKIGHPKSVALMNPYTNTNPYYTLENYIADVKELIKYLNLELIETQPLTKCEEVHE